MVEIIPINAPPSKQNMGSCLRRTGTIKTVPKRRISSHRKTTVKTVAT